MPIADDDLFDFDHSQLPAFDETRARETLERLGDVYRAQLVTARWLDGKRERAIADDSPGNLRSEEFKKGVDYAYRQVIAHLRQGDLVPGGILQTRHSTPNRPSPPSRPPRRDALAPSGGRRCAEAQQA